jgi:hypothetical protein
MTDLEVEQARRAGRDKTSILIYRAWRVRAGAATNKVGLPFPRPSSRVCE